MENEKLKMENYKQTELGLIPDDWEVNRFTDIAELIHGFQFREEHFAENGRFGVIKIGNLTYQGNISLDNLSKSDCEGINNYERLFLKSFPKDPAAKNCWRTFSHKNLKAKNPWYLLWSVLGIGCLWHNEF